MSDVTTPVPAGTDIGKTIAGYLVGLGINWDSAGGEILGLLTANPDPNSLSGRLKTIAAALAATLPVSAAALPLPSGAATDAKLDTVRALLAGVINVAVSSLPLPAGAATDASLVAISTALANQRVESLWTDDSGSYFVRVDKAGAISWFDVAGNAATAPGTGARPAAGATVLLDKSSFQATSAGTGYSVGDYLSHLVTTDPGSGAVLGNFWINASTGVKLAAAPVAANISPISPLPSGAATLAAQTTGNTSLAAIATALLGTLAISAASLPLPTGAATAAGQTSQGTTLGSILTALQGTLQIAAANLPLPTGAATATGVAAVVTALQAVLTTVLNPGEAHIGKVGGETAIALGQFTRPANTTAYASGQLVANSTTAGSVVPLAMSVARINGGTGSIRRARLRSSRVGSGSEVYRVHLFKGPAAATPPAPTVGDGGVFATGVPVVGAIHMGAFDVTLNVVGTDGMKGAAAPLAGGEINFDTWGGQTTIYALIEARGAVTPASGEVFELALEVLRD